MICSDLCDETDLHQNNHFNKLLKLAKPIARVFFIINIFYIYRVRIQPEIASYYTNNCTFFKAFLSIQVCYILCNVLSSKPSERFFIHKPPFLFSSWIKTVVLGFMLRWTYLYEWGLVRSDVGWKTPKQQPATLQEPRFIFKHQRWGTVYIIVFLAESCLFRICTFCSLDMKRNHREERRKLNNWWKWAKEQEP